MIHKTQHNNKLKVLRKKKISTTNPNKNWALIKQNVYVHMNLYVNLYL